LFPYYSTKCGEILPIVLSLTENGIKLVALNSFFFIESFSSNSLCNLEKSGTSLVFLMF